MKSVLFNSGWQFAFENDMEHFNHFGFEKCRDASGAPARFYEYNKREKQKFSSLPIRMKKRKQSSLFLPRIFETTVSGVSGYEYIEFERLGGDAEIYVNGEFVGSNVQTEERIPVNHARPYRFHARFKEGGNKITAVIQTNETADPAMSGYVKIGKTIGPDWKVRLHFGKARVFVKPDTGKKPEVTVEFDK